MADEEQVKKKKHIPYDIKWLQSRKPYFIENGYCLFRYDDMNWAIGKFRENKKEINPSRLAYFNNIHVAAYKFAELTLKGKDLKSVTDLLRELGETIQSIHSFLNGTQNQNTVLEEREG